MVLRIRSLGTMAGNGENSWYSMGLSLRWTNITMAKSPFCMGHSTNHLEMWDGPRDGREVHEKVQLIRTGICEATHTGAEAAARWNRALVSAKQYCDKINSRIIPPYYPHLSTLYIIDFTECHHLGYILMYIRPCPNSRDSRKPQKPQESVGRLHGLTSRMHRCGARGESRPFLAKNGGCHKWWYPKWLVYNGKSRDKWMI